MIDAFAWMIILIDDNQYHIEFEMDEDYPNIIFIMQMFGDICYLWVDDDKLYNLNTYNKDDIIGIDMITGGI